MVVALLVAVFAQAASPPGDSTYSSPAVRELVERASTANRTVPDSLQAYRARVASEMAFIARRADGTEQTFAVEQTESVVQWDRSGRYEQRVVGYRSQAVGVTMSAVGLFRQAWTVPVLYGNRIALFFGDDSGSGRRRARRPQRRQRGEPTIAVHPFAADRERVYRFAGGDTVVTIDPGGRTIPIVRIHVDPSADHVRQPTVAFRGDVELDAQRAQIVRMRGSFVTLRPRAPAHRRRFASPVEAVAYVELENGEFEQRYWLPTYQRVEAQASVALLGDQRAVFRVISRFRRVEINPPEGVTLASDFPLGNPGAPVSAPPRVEGNADDTLGVRPHHLTFAPADSIDRFGEWSHDIGTLTGSARADDFLDVAPDAWRPTGMPLARIRFQEASDLFHYNRVEGAYTGVGGELKLRDAAPGVVVRATAGWAWTEQTLRGRISAERQLGRWQPSARFGRSLDVTNDFREPFDSGSTLGALFSVDDYDYVDRHRATAGLTWVPADQGTVRVHVEGGVGSDRYALARRARGPFARGDPGFRFNRGVDPGRYRFASAKIELNPDVNAAFVRPGIGALIQSDVAAGDIAWRRAEVRLVARRAAGPFIYAARADAGVVAGDSVPPQQLFELGENQNLPGYGYKEFAGDRAAVVRGLVMYPLPLWRAPLRLGRWVLPSVAPTVSFGAQTGWADASNDAARSAILRLGTSRDSVLGRPGSGSGDPVSRPTNGARSSIDFRLRFFGGAVSIGIARATDHHQRWRFVAGLAQVL